MRIRWKQICCILGACILCTGCFRYRFRYDQWLRAYGLMPSEEVQEIPEDFNYEQLIEVFNPVDAKPIRQITEPEVIMEYTNRGIDASKKLIDSLPEDIEILLVLDEYAKTDEYFVNKGYEPITHNKEVLCNANDEYYLYDEQITTSTSELMYIYQIDESFASYLLSLCEGEYSVIDKEKYLNHGEQINKLGKDY